MSLNTIKLPGALLLAVALSLTAAACGTTVTTGSFKGESHAVAQAISNFQTDATDGEHKKLCQNDLALAVRERLKSASGGCEQALKSQLQQIDNFNMTIGSISVLSATTATAKVASTYSGKSHVSTLQLVKEGKSWKVSAIS
jgi:Domain of unknown function (DUF4878)